MGSACSCGKTSDVEDAANERLSAAARPTSQNVNQERKKQKTSRKETSSKTKKKRQKGSQQDAKDGNGNGQRADGTGESELIPHMNDPPLRNTGATINENTDSHVGGRPTLREDHIGSVLDDRPDNVQSPVRPAATTPMTEGSNTINNNNIGYSPSHHQQHSRRSASMNNDTFVLSASTVSLSELGEDDHSCVADGAPHDAAAHYTPDDVMMRRSEWSLSATVEDPAGVAESTYQHQHLQPPQPQTSDSTSIQFDGGHLNALDGRDYEENAIAEFSPVEGGSAEFDTPAPVRIVATSQPQQHQIQRKLSSQVHAHTLDPCISNAILSAATVPVSASASSTDFSMTDHRGLQDRASSATPTITSRAQSWIHTAAAEVRPSTAPLGLSGGGGSGRMMPVLPPLKHTNTGRTDASWRETARGEMADDEGNAMHPILYDAPTWGNTFLEGADSSKETSPARMPLQLNGMGERVKGGESNVLPPVRGQRTANSEAPRLPFRAASYGTLGLLSRSGDELRAQETVGGSKVGAASSVPDFTSLSRSNAAPQDSDPQPVAPRRLSGGHQVACDDDGDYDDNADGQRRGKLQAHDDGRGAVPTGDENPLQRLCPPGLLSSNHNGTVNSATQPGVGGKSGLGIPALPPYRPAVGKLSYTPRSQVAENADLGMSITVSSSSSEDVEDHVTADVRAVESDWHAKGSGGGGGARNGKSSVSAGARLGATYAGRPEDAAAEVEYLASTTPQMPGGSSPQSVKQILRITSDEEKKRRSALERQHTQWWSKFNANVQDALKPGSATVSAPRSRHGSRHTRNAAHTTTAPFAL